MCDVKSVRLLLSKEEDTSFSTPAQSNELAVNADLAGMGTWQLPASQIGTELRMRLPANIDVHSMRLKLEIRSQSGPTVYPQNGNYLSLHQALARATGKSAPCKQLSSPQELATAGCGAELELALSQPSVSQSISAAAAKVQAKAQAQAQAQALGTSAGLSKAAPEPDANTPDALLITALKNEHSALIPMLLARGASPNAEDTNHQGRTALGYAAGAGDLQAMRRLMAAGAKADLQLPNDQGQMITPLTQVLSYDAANAVELLLQSGATLKIADKHGWTPMHIAAYHGAHESISVMVRYGGQVNEKTPGYRQQTAFHTALQHANSRTIRSMLDLGADLTAADNQGQNACGWAEFFKRSAEIKSWVCMATATSNSSAPAVAK